MAEQLSAFERDKKTHENWFNEQRQYWQQLYSGRVSELDEDNAQWIEKNRERVDFTERWNERAQTQDKELRGYTEDFDKERRGIVDKWLQQKQENQEWYERDQKLRESGAGENQIEDARRGYLKEVSDKWGHDLDTDTQKKWLAEHPADFQEKNEKLAGQDFQNMSVADMQPKNAYALDIQTRDGVESNGKYQYKPGGKTNQPLSPLEWMQNKNKQNAADMADIQQKIDDPKTSPAEREKMGLLRDIQQEEHGIMQRRNGSDQAQGEHRQIYLGECESRDARLIEMKQEWNRRSETNPNLYQKIEVTDSLGHERTPEQCRGQATQHARAAQSYMTGGARGNERQVMDDLYRDIGKQSEYQKDYQRTQWAAQEAQAAQQDAPQNQGQKTEAAQETRQEQVQAAGVEHQQQHQQEGEGMQYSESKTPAAQRMEEHRLQQREENKASGQGQAERPQWSRDRAAQAKEALQERQQEMSQGKGQSRSQEQEKEHGQGL